MPLIVIVVLVVLQRTADPRLPVSQRITKILCVVEKFSRQRRHSFARSPALMPIVGEEYFRRRTNRATTASPEPRRSRLAGSGVESRAAPGERPFTSLPDSPPVLSLERSEE